MASNLQSALHSLTLHRPVPPVSRHVCCRWFVGSRVKEGAKVAGMAEIKSVLLQQPKTNISHGKMHISCMGDGSAVSTVVGQCASVNSGEQHKQRCMRQYGACGEESGIISWVT